MQITYTTAVLLALAGSAQALVCEYPEEQIGQSLKVLGPGQYDKVGILQFAPTPSQTIELHYTCHQQLDDAITCVKKLDGGRSDIITILSARTLAVHATLNHHYPMKTEVSVKNIVCKE